jgi:hypothetical protein
MVVCENEKKLKKQGVAPSTFFRRLTAGKNVSLLGGKTAWMLVCCAYTSFLTADFK